MRDDFRKNERITLETRGKDVLELIEEQKAEKPFYAEATQMDILTAFEDIMKDLERDDALSKK